MFEELFYTRNYVFDIGFLCLKVQPDVDGWT